MKEQGFEQWWNAWPKNTTGGYQRKGGKSLCLAKWVKGCYWTQADQIVKHTEWMKTTADWIKDRGMFVPMPITYLNQQRWDGAEIEIVVPVQSSVYVDPALKKIMEDRSIAVAPNAEVRAKMAELLGRRARQ
jgi:hypothetical protein